MQTWRKELTQALMSNLIKTIDFLHRRFYTTRNHEDADRVLDLISEEVKRIEESESEEEIKRVYSMVSKIVI